MKWQETKGDFKMINSQTDLILEHLKQGNPITSLEAFNKFRCFRLGARIYDLKRKGHKIQKTFVKNDNKMFAEYRLTN